MKILMLLDNEFSEDPRVQNEVISLCEAGHEVYVLCLNYGKKQAREVFFGAKIRRIKIPLFWKNKLKGLILTPFEIWKTFWWYYAKKLIREIGDFDFIHAHDLYMLPAALCISQKAGNQPKVVADLHENYPSALRGYKYTQTLLGKLLISIPKWERKEPIWLKKADHIVTVIEEAVERYSGLGLSKSNIKVVPNYVNPDQYLLNNKLEDDQKYAGRFVCIYTGGFDTHRGLETAVKAVDLLRKSIPTILLVLVGGGRTEDELKSQVAELKLQKHVRFEGWVSPEELPSFVAQADVGLIPHVRSAQTDNTIPHKLFHYMLMSLPIVGSDCKPIKRIIEASDSGLVFESGNPEDLAKSIAMLYEQEELRDGMGKAGTIAAKNTYTWEAASQELLAIYST